MALDKIRFKIVKNLDLTHLEQTAILSTRVYSTSFKYAFNYRYSSEISVFVQCAPHNRSIIKHYANIEANPSKWPSWKDFLMSLSFMFPKLKPKDLIISRLDLNVDINYDFDFIRRCLDIDKKKAYETIRSTGKTIVIGKRPKRINIYDRKSCLEGTTIQVPLTRLEIQYYNNACPIRHISEIEKLCELSPFSNFKFYEYNQKGNDLVDEGLNSILHNAYLFDVIRHRLGRARFKRFLAKDYFKLLTEPNLDEIFRHNITNFVEKT